MTTANLKIKRLPAGCLKLENAGDLLLVRCPNKAWSGLFERFEAIFAHFANMEREERLLNYRFILGLILTSHGKKATEPEQKKMLFDMKNSLFAKIANDAVLRRKVAVKYLVSKKFRVLKFCEKCTKKNAADKIPPTKWKFCRGCDVDHDFYNVLSMHHKFPEGSGTLFLSNDRLKLVKDPNLRLRGDLKDFDEIAIFGKFRYNVQNLDAFAVEPVVKICKTKLL